MAACIFECSICNNMFDSGSHKPLCLMCGHTFCYTCVEKISSAVPRSCPNCKKKIDRFCSQIPINYLVIPREQAPLIEKCMSHNYELEYFCVDCSSSVCKKCSRQEHRGHRTELMEDFIDNDPCVEDLRAPILADLAKKLENVCSVINIHDEIFKMIGTARTWKSDVHEGRKVLDSLQDSIIRDLETWEGRGCAMPLSTEKKREIFRALMARFYHSQNPEQHELLKIKNKLSELQKEAAAIQLMVDEQLKSTTNLSDSLGDEELPHTCRGSNGNLSLLDDEELPAKRMRP